MVFDISLIFEEAVKVGASDIHVKAGSPPKLRIKGELQPMEGYDVLTPEDTMNLVYDTMDGATIGKFNESQYELDYAYDIPTLGRFRMNAFKTRGSFAFTGRLLNEHPKSLDDLGTPNILKKLALMKNGIIIVSGPTGSGKSTTMSGMIDYINKSKYCQIISAESPIEVLHQDHKSSVVQREIGFDVRDYSSALKSALRQDPDVILIGEVRDLETLRTVLIAADTGHLVVTTIHSSDTAETINKIISMYPPDERLQARNALAASLRGIIGQRLLINNSNERTIVNEVLLNNVFVSDLIRDESKTSKDIKKVISESNHVGMQTFDQHLVDLMRKNIISVEKALEFSDDPEFINNHYTVPVVEVKKSTPIVKLPSHNAVSVPKVLPKKPSHNNPLKKKPPIL